MDSLRPAALSAADMNRLLSPVLHQLQRTALKLTRNPHHAEDLVQTTILKALANRDKFIPGSNFAAWLTTILVNTFKTEYRKSKREVMGDEAFWQVVEANQEALDPNHALRLDLPVALSKLRPHQLKLIRTYLLDGGTYDQLAAIYGVPVGTIKSRLNRAREGLLRLLESDIQPKEGTMATHLATAAPAPPVADLIQRITTLAMRHPKHFGNLVLNALGAVGLSVNDLAETYEEKNLQPHDVKFLMPWLQVNLGASRPQWREEHISAMLVLFDTTPSKFLTELERVTGETPRVVDVPPPPNPKVGVLSKFASENGKRFSQYLLDFMVAKNIATTDGLAKAFAEANLEPGEGTALFLALRGEDETPMTWSAAHVAAAVEFLGNQPEELIAFIKQRIETAKQNKVEAKVGTPPAGAKPPVVPAVPAPPPPAAAVMAPTPEVKPPPSSDGTLAALLARAKAERFAFGKLIKALLQERELPIKSLHAALYKANAAGEHPANTSNLLGGYMAWNEHRLWATAQYLKLDLATLDARFTAWLAEKEAKAKAPAAAMAPTEPAPSATSAAVMAPEADAPEPAAVEAPAVVTTPEPETSVTAQEERVPPTPPAAVMAPDVAAPAATAMATTAPAQPVAANGTIPLNPVESGMIQLTQTQLAAMAEPARMTLLLATIQQQGVNPNAVSNALWQVLLTHLAALPEGTSRTLAIHGLLGQTLEATE